jgi:glucosamine-6-phosphate deaminase
VTVLGLDEYLGLAADDPRSFRAELDRQLAAITLGRREALDGAAPDPDMEAARYQAVLDAAPIDLAVLGLGRDAHVAFNEPGSRPGEGVRRVALAESTIAAAAGDFGGPDRVPREALTVGLRTLETAREVLVLVTGEEKAQALREMLEGPVGPRAPASLLRGHPCLTVLCDASAARMLRRTRHRDSDHVALVLGHREPGLSAEHRISDHSRARLQRAVQLCRAMPVRAVVLTGFTHTGGLSEAEQMAREWPLDDVPTLLEVAGRNTAETRRGRCRSSWPRAGAARQRGHADLAPAHALLLRPVPGPGTATDPAARASPAGLAAPARRGARRRGRHARPAACGDGRCPPARGRAGPRPVVRRNAFRAGSGWHAGG